MQDTASEAQSTVEIPAVAAAVESEHGWAIPGDPDTFVQEGADLRRTDESADASRTRPPASVAYFTGLEWTTNS